MHWDSCKYLKKCVSISCKWIETHANTLCKYIKRRANASCRCTEIYENGSKFMQIHNTCTENRARRSDKFACAPSSELNAQT